jgi:pyruvate, water dikinase
VHASTQPLIAHHSRRDLFDRDSGGVDIGDLLGDKELFCPRDFGATLGEGRIAALGTTFESDPTELFRNNGQPVQARTACCQHRRQTTAFEVFFGERVIAGFQRIMHRKVEASRGFSTAGHANQYDIGLVQIADAHAIVVAQRKIKGTEAPFIQRNVTHAVHATGGVRGLLPDRGLEWLDKRAKQIEHVLIARRDDVLRGRISQCAKDERWNVIFEPCGTDGVGGALSCGLVGHEGNRSGGKVDAGELRQQALAQGFDGNPGPIGNKEHAAFHWCSQLADINESSTMARSRIEQSSQLSCLGNRMADYIVTLDQTGMHDVARVGGKNASLGEMIRHLSAAGVSVPGGFATTAQAFRDFLAQGGLAERIQQRLAALNTDDVGALSRAGRDIRQWIVDTPLQASFDAAIDTAYRTLTNGTDHDFSVAVRSSATAEDLPTASFAGQQETYLNVTGALEVKRRIKDVFASLFNDRAISYRTHHGFDHYQVALSAGVQRMVRSDVGASGVMFTLDTESGFRDVVFITASYGLGELVVQGAVNPDEFYVSKPALKAGRPAILRRNLGTKQIRMSYAASPAAGHAVVTHEVTEQDRGKFSITDADIEALARIGLAIEAHYGRPMDIEWARDGIDGCLYVVQARPETVQSRPNQVIERFSLERRGEVLVEGRSIGQRIGSGRARIITDLATMGELRDGDVLVTDMTDPDWEPVMKRAAAIVTNRGGRTCHAAIIARELGVPAVVGCGDATRRIKEGQAVTVSCAEGDTGFVYAGTLAFARREITLAAMPDLPVKLMMNVGNPDRAFAFANLPHRGVGLARLEFIINRMIGIHPRALLEFDTLPPALQATIAPLISAYASPREFFVTRLTEGIATIGAAFAPHPVIVRLSDFKSNEYANLVGGERYEPHEENPMLGFRGASRYLSPAFRMCFEMECEALRRVRDGMGITNVQVMVPFVRTPDEARQVVELLARNGLKRGDHGLRLIMMCELPSNALLAEAFLEYFDGFSIGSNDLTQLTLGLDRDSGLIANLFDERNEAVKTLMAMAIGACRKAGKYIGICGQGPSDHPELAAWLLAQGIESMSLNPDTIVETWMDLAGRQ